jgi:calcineurin-like phosphoesterase family protein
VKSTELYFTSDTHFGHKMMAELRGFSSIDEMDEALVWAWNEAIPPKGAHVFHLGDVSFRKNAATAEILRRLNGTKYLLEGNHDRLSLICVDEFEWVKDYYELTVEDTKQRLVMCHYAFRVWNRGHYGAWNLHGHSHGNLHPTGGQIDVGVDTHSLHPYSYAEITAAMATRPYVSVDHHKLREPESNRQSLEVS